MRAPRATHLNARNQTRALRNTLDTNAHRAVVTTSMPQRFPQLVTELTRMSVEKSPEHEDPSRVAPAPSGTCVAVTCYGACMDVRLFFGSFTAMQFYRAVLPPDHSVGAAADVTRHGSFDVGPATDNPAWNLSFLTACKGPAHLYVSSEAARKRVQRYFAAHPIVNASGAKQRIQVHVMNIDVPPGSYIEHSRNVYLATPAMAFAQIATEASLPRLIRYGFEITGRYALSPSTPSGCVERAPLTSTTALTDMVNALSTSPHPPRGIKLARKAVGYVLGGSRSPREAESLILLTLPKRLGGYGIRQPDALNHRIRPSAAQRRLVSQQYYECDAFWRRDPKKRVPVGGGTRGTVLEYDGIQTHPDPDHDKLRRDELKLLGIEMLVLNDGIIRQVDRMDRFAQRLARALGMRWRQATERDYAERKLALRRELFKNG